MTARRIVAAGFTLVAFCILIALGVWQLQRLRWKTDLLHRIAALQAAPAEPIDAVLRRVQDHVDISYTRVQVACPGLQQGPTVRLYAVFQGLAGYRVVTACPLQSGPFGSVLVDRGFVAQPGDDAPREFTGPAIAAPVTGVLRTPDPPTFVTPKNQPGQNLWFWRDIPGMAAALHAPRPAPAMLMLESPAPPGAEPRPAPLPLNLPNNHLGYAVTWFSLAAALVGVYLAMLFRKRPD